MISFELLGKEFSVQETVYLPQEDSFLLANSIKKTGNSFLDMGTGSGIQSLNALMLGFEKITAVDKNPKALENVKRNAELLGKEIQTIESDLFENVEGKFDVIAFNPPYLESEEFNEIELDGGKKGREVLDRFLHQVKMHLNPNGAVYFLQNNLNGEEKTKKLLESIGFKWEIIAKQKLFFEELMVFRASQ